MEYTRGSDILSALKYFYSTRSNNQQLPEELAKCNSILEAVRVFYEFNGPASNLTELFNAMGDEYNSHDR